MSHAHSQHRIGVFDSGVGGLTVLKEIARLLPDEEIVYFGDTARVPYGSKSPETIIRYSIENAIFLMEQGIKILVVACNTATSVALEKMQKIFNIPVIGVIEPGVDKAIMATQNKRVGVLGTRGTIASGAYQKKIKEKLEGAEVWGVACPLFVPLAEEKMFSHPVAEAVAKEYLNALSEKEVDVVLLGCTHYPLMKGVIQQVVGPNVQLIDSATTCAERVKETLERHNLCNVLPQVKQPGLLSRCQFFVSDDPEKFKDVAEEFIGEPISLVSLAKQSH